MVYSIWCMAYCMYMAKQFPYHDFFRAISQLCWPQKGFRIWTQSLPTRPNVPLFRALQSRLQGSWDVLKGSAGMLVKSWVWGSRVGLVVWLPLWVAAVPGRRALRRETDVDATWRARAIWIWKLGFSIHISLAQEKVKPGRRALTAQMQWGAAAHLGGSHAEPSLLSPFQEV